MNLITRLFVCVRRHSTILLLCVSGKKKLMGYWRESLTNFYFYYRRDKIIGIPLWVILCEGMLKSPRFDQKGFSYKNSDIWLFLVRFGKVGRINNFLWIIPSWKMLILPTRRQFIPATTYGVGGFILAGRNTVEEN